MKQHEATDSVRLNKEFLNKVRDLAKSKRQTLSGFMELRFGASIERDWKKLQHKNNERTGL